MLSESQTTKNLAWYLFSGSGTKYLGFRFADKELQEDGSWETLPSRWDRKEKRWVYNYDHPEYWSVPQGNWYWKTSALNDHLRGKPRGLVVHEDTDATSVPFLAVDLDRHHKEDKRKHIERVVRVGRLCQRLFPHLRWLVEVNLNNGSTKLYGFARKHLPINKAREMAETLHAAVVQITGDKNTEVFCHNMPQILLPFRQDKCTIITDSELGKTQRYKIINGKREYFEAYSMCEFDSWLYGHGHYDEQTLIETLERACEYKVVSPIGDIKTQKPVSKSEQMMHEAYREAMGLPVSDIRGFAPKSDGTLGRAINRDSKAFGGVRPTASQNLDDIRNIANAFHRKHEFSMWLSRRLRRVPTADEVLSAYKEHKMFNGSWETKEKSRRSDFSYILPFVEKSFDASLCGTGNCLRPELNNRINLWKGRAVVTFVWKTEFHTTINQVRVVDEYGNASFTCGKQRTVSGKQLPIVMAIIDQVRKERSDGGIPRDSIQGWWEELAQDGLLPAWNKETWQAYRQVLVQIGWMSVNHKYSHRQHQAKTCKILYGNKLVGVVYTYPTATNNNTPTPITVVAHSTTTNLGSDDDSTPRPPPRGQPPPIRRYLPSFEEQISWS